MTMLVSLAQAKIHLRIDGPDPSPEDADLTLKIEAASGAVLNYIRSSVPSFLDSSGDPLLDSAGDPIGIPYEVKAATLLLLGDLYKERDAINAAEWEHGFLPKSVLSMLYPYRMPSMA